MRTESAHCVVEAGLEIVVVKTNRFLVSSCGLIEVSLAVLDSGLEGVREDSRTDGGSATWTN